MGKVRKHSVQLNGYNGYTWEHVGTVRKHSAIEWLQWSHVKTVRKHFVQLNSLQWLQWLHMGTVHKHSVQLIGLQWLHVGTVRKHTLCN